MWEPSYLLTALPRLRKRLSRAIRGLGLLRMAMLDAVLGRIGGWFALVPVLIGVGIAWLPLQVSFQVQRLGDGERGGATMHPWDREEDVPLRNPVAVLLLSAAGAAILSGLVRRGLF